MSHHATNKCHISSEAVHNNAVGVFSPFCSGRSQQHPTVSAGMPAVSIGRAAPSTEARATRRDTSSLKAGSVPSLHSSMPCSSDAVPSVWSALPGPRFSPHTEHNSPTTTFRLQLPRARHTETLRTPQGILLCLSFLKIALLERNEAFRVSFFFARF